MSFFRSALMAALIISVNAQAFEAKVEIVEQFDSFKIVAFISAQEIADNPDWQPSLGEPPLSIGAAIQAVSDFTKTKSAINEIEIRQVADHQQKWHYLIRVANESMQAKNSIYVVLMNGKVISGIIEFF